MKVNLAEALARIEDAYSPLIVGYLNDYKLAVVKPRGTPNTGDAGGPMTQPEREL